MKSRTFTEEHVKKLIALAFIQGQEFAVAKMIKQANNIIGVYDDTQPEDNTHNPVNEREATNNFLTAFS